MVGAETEMMIAPFGVGVGTSGVKIEQSMKLGLSSTYNQEKTMSSSASDVEDLVNKIEFSYSYTTADEADKAGPASDAFLVPAMFYDVTRVWMVSYYNCEINGFPSTSLVANADLSGFAFTQANDIETRTMPTLLAAKEAVTFRELCFDRPGSDACCRESDTDRGCNATNLQEYCDWFLVVTSPEQRQEAAWRDCYAVDENRFKSLCKSEGKCNRKGTKYTDVRGYCDALVASYSAVSAAQLQKNADAGLPNDVGQCMAFEDSGAIKQAYKHWNSILYRNYMHHRVVRCGSACDDAPYQYDEDDLVSPGAVIDRTSIIRLSPKILAANVKDFTGTAKEAMQDKWASYNVLQFDGGGSSIEFGTNQFDNEEGALDKIREGTERTTSVQKSKMNIVRTNQLAYDFNWESVTPAFATPRCCWAALCAVRSEARCCWCAAACRPPVHRHGGF